MAEKAGAHPADSLPAGNQLIPARHGQGEADELLHPATSLSSLDGAIWSANARRPRSLVFRKGAINSLALARMPRRLSEWDWVSIECLQAMPLEVQEAVRSAQERQSSILGYACYIIVPH